MTICPGKQAPTSIGGHAWARDLSIDLRAILEWGAGAVVTLMENWEVRQYGVSELGPAVDELGMRWYHLPIVDGAAPDASWDESWSKTHSHELHQFLGAGGAVLIHCLGGRGRTGTVAARLLIESGMDAEEAIRKVREAREGAIETREQEIYLRALRP
ncbi:MAG: cyclin-dependent kinase inhibitor 3 family protein [Rhodocyclaceae bacterium]